MTDRADDVVVKKPQDCSNSELASRLYRLSHNYSERHPNYESLREAARRLDP